MVSHKRVFPTKSNTWVTLAHKPMIADSPHLEKIFKSHREICLLNLPSAVKRTNRSKHQGKLKEKRIATVSCAVFQLCKFSFFFLSSGKLHEKEAFSEADRELFLDICGLKRLSQCVTTEAQTESYRPCPSVQTLVRQIIPYIQRFIYHHADFEDVYSELKDGGIAKQINSMSFGQVWNTLFQWRQDTCLLLHHILSQGSRKKFILFVIFVFSISNENQIIKSGIKMNQNKLFTGWQTVYSLSA